MGVKTGENEQKIVRFMTVTDVAVRQEIMLLSIVGLQKYVIKYNQLVIRKVR